MKTYYFERVSREAIKAQSEEEARLKLEELGYLQDEFELTDVVEDADDAVPVALAPETGSKVIDLMAALKESLARE